MQASRLGKMSAFRRQFRECSALLLDDLHFLATKKATQEEFLHTFDALVADGRQVVVTTDCHPRLADELMPELVDRLLGGAVWGLLPPDPETRLEILRKKSYAASARDPRQRAEVAGDEPARERARTGRRGEQRPPLREGDGPPGRHADRGAKRSATCCGTRSGW